MTASTKHTRRASAGAEIIDFAAHTSGHAAWLRTFERKRDEIFAAMRPLSNEVDADLIALGRQWQEAHEEWNRTSDACQNAYDAGESSQRVHQLEAATDEPCLRTGALERRIAGMPAVSIEGALVKLRVVVAENQITGEIDGPCGRLAYQVWQALEAACDALKAGVA